MTQAPARRAWLRHACVHCLAWGVLPAWAQQPSWSPPDRLARPTPDSDEGGLWAMMDREESKLRRGGFLLQDKGLQAYLTALVCRLAGDHCPDVRVYAVRTPAVNALMAPNGMMQVWGGLLLRVSSEAQLASVLGHELGHYFSRHSLARLREARGGSAFATLMVPFGLVGLVGQLAALAGMLSYSREQEREADRIGLQLTQRAGYDARQAAALWADLRAELAAGAGGDPAKKSVLFASHPGVDERQALLESLARDAGGTLGEEDYLRHLGPVLPELIDDELKRGQYDESIVLFTRRSQRRPERGDFRYALGEARRLRGQDGDVAAAEQDLRAALTLEQPPAATHRSLGLLLRQQDRRAEARDAFQRYLQAAPNAADAGMIQSYLNDLS